VKGKVKRTGTWTLRAGRTDEVSAEVEVVVDHDALDEVVRRVVWTAMTSKRGRALFHHGMVRARVLRRGRVGS
jgi:hypothetical protein